MHAHRSVPTSMVFAALGVAMFLGCSEKGKDVQTAEPKRAGGDEPGFRISRGVFSDPTFGITGLYWTITNTLDTPLKVTRVTYNGEWQAPRAEIFAERLRRTEAGLPVQLTIGEACHIFQYQLGEHAPGSVYTKAVIYIDIETNRGTFRHQVDEAHLELPKSQSMYKMPPSSSFGK